MSGKLGKLGGYNQRGGNDVQRHWLAAGYGWAVALNHDPDFWRPIQDRWGTRIVSRTYFADQSLDVGRAQYYADAICRDADRLRAGGVQVEAVMGLNETGQTSAEAIKRLADLELAMIDVFHARGYKYAAGSFGVTWPKLEHLPYYRDVLETCDYFKKHEYDAPSMRSNVNRPGYDDRVLYYRQLYAEMARLGIRRPPLLLGECGIDGGVLDGHLRGFRAFPATDYFGDLAWYATEVAKDVYVAAAVVFGVGMNSDWQSFDVVGTEVARKLEAATFPVPEERGMGIIDISDSLPRHPSKVWRHRDQAPNCIVIHHSVTPSDYPIERIAEYHISRGYPGIAYHYVIPGNGKVYQTNDDMAFTWHGNDGNTGLGVCLLGDFTECEPTSAQIASARWLIADLRDKYGDLPVLGHKECGRAQTECPGRTWEQWKHKLIVAAPSSPVPSPSEPSEEENMGIQAFDWQGRPTTVEALQAKYKFRIRQAEGVEAGQEVFRIKAIREKAGDTAVIVRCTVDGEPDAGRMVAGYWPDAPQSNPSPFPWDWYPNYTLAKTNANGEVAAVVMGPGSVIQESGPHAVWVVSPSTKSDCLDGIGWLGGTDHMHVDVEFALVVQPEPAPDVPESHLEAIRNKGWNLAGVDYNPDAALTRYAQLHGLGAPLGQEGRVEVGGKRYAVQPFRDVIVYAVEGAWDRIKELDY